MSKPAVLCVRKEEFHTLLVATKYAANRERGSSVFSVLERCIQYWIPRDIAETDERYLQVIPYVSVMSPSLTAGKRAQLLLTYCRNGGDEKRLDAKWSCGFGGHIELSDEFDGEHSRWSNIVTMATVRELCEELVWDYCHLLGGMLPTIKVNGFIYTGDHDAGGPVDRVHLGIDLTATLGDFTQVRMPKAVRKEHWEWINTDQKSPDARDYELWTQVVMFGDVVKPPVAV